MAKERLSTTRVSPPSGQNGIGLSPPESDQNLSTRVTNNQKPASGSGPQSGVSEGKGKEAKPNLRDIKRQDLGSVERLMDLFDQAKAVGLVIESYMERLNFAALAEHCRARGSENPPGMFARLLRWRKNPDGSARNPAPAWHFVTEGDEEAVRRKVSAFVYDEPELLASRVGESDEEGSLLEPLTC